ncbi:gamma-aminobutyric acid type B receptor subunit 2-like isoform X1, partial [Paramuricea clavata]
SSKRSRHTGRDSTTRRDFLVFERSESSVTENRKIASRCRIASNNEKPVIHLKLAARDLRNQIIKDKLNITLITIEGFSQFTEGHPRIQLENLQKLDARIIIGEFSASGAVAVFCEAYKMGMVGQKYVWLLPATTTGAWIFSPSTFRRFYPGTDCNVSHIIEAADGFIVSDKVPIRQDNNETLSGLTAVTFNVNRLLKHNAPRPYTSYAFDSVWAAALLFQESLSYPKYRPENVEFGNIMARNYYSWFLSKTKFEGLTGPHHFDHRQRLGTVRINQMRNANGTAELIQVGSFISINSAESKMNLYESQLSKLWKDGKVPVDETTKERKILTYSILQLVVIAALAVFGLLYSIFLLYFNISKRNHKVVRMSSPMINNVVLLGCFFCYVFVFLLEIDSRFVDDHVFGILCNVRLYVLAIAFSLAFGALFSKTWRVHKIFTAQRAIKKKLMRDFHLILFVLALVIIDVTFITVWVYYHPLEMKEIIFDELREDSRDLITIPVLKICECTYRTKLLGVLYGYKGILLLFGVFLAWETRNVTIPALNDSKYIGMSVYNVVILSAIGATVSMVLKTTVYYELLHVMVSAIVVLSTTVTLTMVFAPKVYPVYRCFHVRTRTSQIYAWFEKKSETEFCFDFSYISGLPEVRLTDILKMCSIESRTPSNSVGDLCIQLGYPYPTFGYCMVTVLNWERLYPVGIQVIHSL